MNNKSLIQEFDKVRYPLLHAATPTFDKYDPTYILNDIRYTHAYWYIGTLSRKIFYVTENHKESYLDITDNNIFICETMYGAIDTPEVYDLPKELSIRTRNKEFVDAVIKVIKNSQV